MRRKGKVNNIVVISDLHCGCQLGLCPPKVRLDNGGIHLSSEMQRKVWTRWLEWWDVWVPIYTKDEPWDLVVNGDCLDGVHHGSVTQISQNLSIQAEIAKAILEPIVAKADKTLEEGSVDGLISKMTQHLTEGVRERFDRALKTSKHKDESVEAGREYVEAYVEYMHYMEGIHKAVMGQGGHKHEEVGEGNQRTSREVRVRSAEDKEQPLQACATRLRQRDFQQYRQRLANVKKP